MTYVPSGMSDDDADNLVRLLLQADIANVARLHAAGMKAGYSVNGRDSIHPITFANEVAASRPLGLT